MYCYRHIDYPKRAKTNTGKVIHAANIFIREPYTSVSHLGKVHHPKKEIIRIACIGANDDNLYEVDHTKNITCKNCMKALGMLEKATFSKRYVLCEIESGYFYRKAGYRQNWVNNFADATLYKIRAAAEKNGYVIEYFDGCSKQISRKEFYVFSTSERLAKGYYYRRRFAEEKYKVMIVNLNLEEDHRK